MKLRPLFKCHGGKYYLCDWIIRNFPENYTTLEYYEIYGGAASVLLNKCKSVGEFYNELNKDIVGMFLNISNPEFRENLKKAPYTRQVFNNALSLKNDYSQYSQERAACELVIRRFSRGGLGRDFAWSKRERGGKPGDVNAWETFLNTQLDLIAHRFKDVHIASLDGVEYVWKLANSPTCLIYADPPYLPETRTAKNTYNEFEMTTAQHQEFLIAAQNTKAKMLISGYASNMYFERLKSWNLVTKTMANNAGQNKIKQKRIECLWKNY